MNYLERAREFFRNDHYATDATGIVIEIDKRHQNGIGQVMGAVYSTLVDFSFAIASNFDRPMTVTLQSSITFMNACRGDILFASCRRANEGGRTCFYDVHVTDNVGTQIVQATVTGYKLSSNFSHPMSEGEDPYREQQLLLIRLHRHKKPGRSGRVLHFFDKTFLNRM